MFVELNASATRSKRTLHEAVASHLGCLSLDAFVEGRGGVWSQERDMPSSWMKSMEWLEMRIGVESGYDNKLRILAQDTSSGCCYHSLPKIHPWVINTSASSMREVGI